MSSRRNSDVHFGASRTHLVRYAACATFTCPLLERPTRLGVHPESIVDASYEGGGRILQSGHLLLGCACACQLLDECS